nr:MAG TPA: hypothetical protein [Caudoviricetes sp.]
MPYISPPFFNFKFKSFKLCTLIIQLIFLKVNSFCLNYLNFFLYFFSSL